MLEDEFGTPNTYDNCGGAHNKSISWFYWRFFVDRSFNHYSSAIQIPKNWIIAPVFISPRKVGELQHCIAVKRYCILIPLSVSKPNSCPRFIFPIKARFIYTCKYPAP